MVKIFILYGGPEGNGYANTINEYFKKNGLNSFLASRNSPDMIPGRNYQPQIDDNLVTSEIAIVIITTELQHSVAAMDEIRQLQSILPIPYIPYEQKDCEIPEELSNDHRIVFDPVNFGELELKELELKMWRTLDMSRRSPPKTKETTQPTQRIEVPYIG